MRGRAGKKGLLVEGWDTGLVGAEAGSSMPCLLRTVSRDMSSSPAAGGWGTLVAGTALRT